MRGFIVGTMSTQSGWETQSPYDALSWHITYWFAARKSQLKAVADVPSFYALWEKYGTDPVRLENEVRSALRDYIAELFDDCVADVKRENVEGQVNNYRLIISARVKYDGAGYDLSRAVEITGEKYKLLDDERLAK